MGVTRLYVKKCPIFQLTKPRYRTKNSNVVNMDYIYITATHLFKLMLLLASSCPGETASVPVCRREREAGSTAVDQAVYSQR